VLVLPETVIDLTVSANPDRLRLCGAGIEHTVDNGCARWRVPSG
jgi:hypothetical protein